MFRNRRYNEAQFAFFHEGLVKQKMAENEERYTLKIKFNIILHNAVLYSKNIGYKFKLYVFLVV